MQIPTDASWPGMNISSGNGHADLRSQAYFRNPSRNEEAKEPFLRTLSWLTLVGLQGFPSFLGGMSIDF